MRRHRFRVLCSSLFAVVLAEVRTEAAEQPAIPAGRISATEFTENKRTIVGLLGVSLGTVVEIEASIVAGSAVPDAPPNLARPFLLSVEKVNGIALSPPKVVDFIVQSEATLPASYADLPSSKTQASKFTTTELEAALIAEARKYVGSRHRLTVYEAGRFDGVPKKIPEDCMPWSGYNFGYHPYLVVLKTRGTESPPLKAELTLPKS